MLTTIFFREGTVNSLHDALVALGAVQQPQLVDGESTWFLQSSDGAPIHLHVIEDFGGYSVEIWWDVLLNLAPAYEALGTTPRLTLEVTSRPASEKAARQLVHDVLAVHPGVSHDDYYPGLPIAEEDREEAEPKMRWYCDPQ